MGDVVRACIRPAPPSCPPNSNFPCRYLAPLGGESESSDEQLLSAAVRVALEAAASRGCASVSLPAISSGLFGFPRRLACDVIVKAAFDFLDATADSVESNLKQVNLTNIDEATTADMAAALERFTSRASQGEGTVGGDIKQAAAAGSGGK